MIWLLHVASRQRRREEQRQAARREIKTATVLSVVLSVYEIYCFLFSGDGEGRTPGGGKFKASKCDSFPHVVHGGVVGTL